MKQTIKILASVFIMLSVFACNNASTDTTQYYCPMKCEGEKVYDEEGSCPVCHMDLVPVEESNKVLSDENEVSDASIFNLTSKWNTQNNETIELKELNGDVLVMVMIYTTCKAACPRLVADMRSISEKVDNKEVKYVLVSIDPENDTPQKLKAFAIENKMDTDQWVFLQGTVDDVREFSNVLSVKYKQISPLDFSHSNIISVFNKGGELHHQQEGLGVDNAETVSKILSLTK
ncbi:MAG TPA: SCO family protein [Bacteroidetes bacterium]|nr:SCO family protein [Bacteroidota bacterium]